MSMEHPQTTHGGNDAIQRQEAPHQFATAFRALSSALAMGIAVLAADPIPAAAQERPTAAMPSPDDQVGTEKLPFVKLHVVREWKAFFDSSTSNTEIGYYFPGDDRRAPHMKVVFTGEDMRDQMVMGPALPSIVDIANNNDGTVSIVLKQRPPEPMPVQRQEGWTKVR